MKTNSYFQNMRNWMLSIIAVTGMTLSANAQNNNTEISADVRAQIEQLNQDISRQFTNKNIAEIVDLYADDATIIAPGGKKIQGRKAIAEYWYNLAAAKSVKSEITELGGNSKVVYEISRWTIVTVKDGQEVSTSADVMLVWKRGQDYNYKIQVNSFNNAVAVNQQAVNPFEASKD